jgi:hypothetical protein
MANRGLSPIDPTAPVGQVRLLLGDTDATNLTTTDGVQTGEYLYYSDAEISGLLAMYDNSPKRTAARALRTIAASQTLLLKKFQSADVMVDMPAAAKELRLLADALEKEADSGDDRAGLGEIFQIAGGSETGIEIDWQQDYPGLPSPVTYYPTLV